MATANGDRNLLFGILALQMDFIRRDALVQAMNAWVLDKAKPLGQILVEQGALRADAHTLLEALVQKHLEMHGGDAEKSLAAVSSIRSIREELQGIADPDVQNSLAHVPAARPSGADPYATEAPSVGAPSAEGRRFRILRPHAVGGLGKVSVAHDEELHREVALKEIQERYADYPESRSRFLAEAEITGRLEHPSIVPVYGLGQYADGRPFYAMRFIRGDSLKEAVERFHKAEGQRRPAGERALELRKLLGRFLDVCNAIAYAHSRGVLHRDLKPGNIMLGQYGETLVVDWGLAKPLEKMAVPDTAEGPLRPSAASGSAATEMGRAVGTPAYMSPEQAAGRLDQLGPASDVYSLGATLYAVLTGKPPFEERELGPLLRKVERGEFPPPRQVNPKVSRPLEAVCLKAMALRPEDRYASPRALADDLEHWLGDEPVAAYREPLSARLGRWARRNRTLVTGAGALLLTAVVALGISTLLIGKEQQKTEEQRRQAVNALDKEKQARKERAQAQVDALLDANSGAVPAILQNLRLDQEEVLPRLRELWEQQDLPERQRLRVGLALLPVDDAPLSRLREGMLAADAEPAEMLVLRDALAPHGQELAPDLWGLVDDPKAAPERRFRALVALASFDPANERWAKAGGQAVEQFLAANPLHLGLWINALRPVRASLVGPLSEVFRDHSRGEKRQVAARVLADYAADRPEVVADLLCDADERSFPVLLEKLRLHREAVTLLQKELAREPTFDWKDAPLDPAWAAPAAAIRQEIEQADGILAERFALCQTLPLERFSPVAEALRGCGYRPVRLRPYAVGTDVRTAAVWSRDGREWRMVVGKTPDQMRASDAENRKQGYRPEDVAGYLASEGALERYAAVWARPASADDEAQLYVGVPEDKLKSDGWGPLKDAGLIPRAYQILRGGDSRRRFSGVWGKTSDNPAYLDAFGSVEAEYLSKGTANKVGVDVCLYAAAPPADAPKRYADQLAAAEKTLLTKPDDLKALFQAGQARFRLGQDREALADLEALIAKTTNPSFTGGYQYRAFVNARLGNADAARTDLAAFLKRSTSAGLNVSVPAVVAAYLGEDVDGMAKLEEAVAANKADAQMLYNAAEAAALTAHIVRTHQTERLRAGLAVVVGLPGQPAPPLPLEWLEKQLAARADAYAERAVALLRQAVDASYSDFANMQTDYSFDSIRRNPGFIEVLGHGHLERQYAAVWHDSAPRESAESHGLSPAEHLARCRALAAEGYRPVALSVAVVAEGQAPVTASVWQRPVIPKADRAALAKRQATAAAALLLLGDDKDVWPLYRHSPDPTRRSYLLALAAPLGVEARRIATRLEDEPDVSARRALILALGEYGPEQLPSDLRGRLTARLLGWYRDDTDPGVHGAVDWLLRNAKEGPEPRKLDWGQAAALKAIDDALRRREPDPDRGWYVNGQGQTMVLVPGPVEFRMGSPWSEARPYDNEIPHRRRIGRSFAIANKSVTVEEFQQFLKERPDVARANTRESSPDADGPINGVSWFVAAQYCNWLSEKEGLPQAEWCYPKHADVKEGMKPFPDALRRKGYRLPTEAEWEYAARAGTQSSRYYGSSEELLPRYAWFSQNSRDRAWPVGQKRPNDLGLFDVHGNVWNWTQNASDNYSGNVNGKPVEDIEDIKDIEDKLLRVLRGGGFLDHPVIVRSAYRSIVSPSYRGVTAGLRPARTYD